MQGSDSKYIPLTEAEKYCSYSADYLKLRARQGKLKATKIGRMWVTRKEWVEEYVRRMQIYKENRKAVKRKQGVPPPPPPSPERKFKIPIFFTRAVPAALLIALMISGIVFGKPFDFTQTIDSIYSLYEELATTIYSELVPNIFEGLVEPTKEVSQSLLENTNQVFENVSSLPRELREINQDISIGFSSLKTATKDGISWTFDNISQDISLGLSFLKRGAKNIIGRTSTILVQPFRALADISTQFREYTGRLSDTAGVTIGKTITGLKNQITGIKGGTRELGRDIQEFSKDTILGIKSFQNSLVNKIKSVQKQTLGIPQVLGGQITNISREIQRWSRVVTKGLKSFGGTLKQETKDFVKGIKEVGKGLTITTKTQAKKQAGNLKKQLVRIREAGVEFGNSAAKKIIDIKEGIVQRAKSLARTFRLFVQSIFQETKRLVSNIKNLVVESLIKTKNFFVGVYQFVIRPWRAPPEKVVIEIEEEEIIALKEELQKLKEEGIPAKIITKEIEVSKITKIEPIKEIEKITQITKVDEEELVKVKATLADWQEDIEELGAITEKLQARPVYYGIQVRDRRSFTSTVTFDALLNISNTILDVDSLDFVGAGDITAATTIKITGADEEIDLSGGNVKVVLGDDLGVNQFQVADSTGAVVAWIDSDGNANFPGGVAPGGNIVMQSGKWIGLGPAVGRIVFTDAAQDTLTISDAHLLFSADNTYDIGATGATRPRRVYVGTEVVVAGTTTLGTDSLSATGALTLSSGGAAALTLDSDSGTVRVIAGDTLQADTITDGTATLSGGALTGLTTPLTVAQGGTGVATFGGTNTILYTTTTDNLSSIATDNSGVLVTGGTGIPSIATDIPTAVTIGGAYIYRVGGTDVANADVADDLTISGGTIDNTVIGGTTATTATFTNIGLNDAINQIILDADAAVNKGTITMAGLSGAQTWTFPDATGTVYTSGNDPLDTIAEWQTLCTNCVDIINDTTGTLTVARGGTGATSLTDHGVLFGSDTSAITALATGSANQILTSGGAGADPSWTTATYPATATTTGTILRADGTNWVATTATYPATTTINQLLYSSSANVVDGLATDNSGVLVTGGTGIPSIATDIPTAVTIGGAYVYRVGGTDVADADVADDITASNYLPLVGGTMTGALMVDGSADVIQLTVQGHSTQNNDLVVFEQSGGTDVFVIDNSGNLTGAGYADFASYVLASELRSEGNIYVNYDGADGDSYLYFYENSSETGASMKWDDTDSEFDFSNALNIAGGTSKITSNNGNFTIDALSASDTTVTIENSDGSHIANLSVKGNLGLGDGTAVNYVLTFDALAADGTITWDEDPGEFDISADINVTGDVGGTTIGGITEANLADLTDDESITGDWVNTDNPWAADELVSTVMVEGENATLLDGTNWRVFYTDGSGNVTELALGADGTFLQSGGTTVLPEFTALVAGDIPNISGTTGAIGATLVSLAGLTETHGGIPYGTADNAYAWLGAGAEGTLLMGNAAAAPSWLGAGTAGYFLKGNDAADPVWTQQSGLISLEELTVTNGDMIYASGADAYAVLDHGELTEILVGGGATAPVWTTVTGTGAPVRATSPTFTTSVIMSDGATLGQAAGPLLTFDDTGDDLEITGANVGLAQTSPISQLSVGAGSSAAVTDGTTTTSTLGINLSITEASKYAMGILNSNVSGDGLLIQAGDASDDYTLRVEDYDRANDLFVVRGDGTVGIGTATPGRRLDVLHTVSNAQQRISYDATKFVEFYVDSTGDLTLSLSGGGDDIKLVGAGDSTGANLWICSGAACVVDGFTLDGDGSLFVENDAYFGGWQNHVKIGAGGVLTFVGSADITLPALSVDAGTYAADSIVHADILDSDQADTKCIWFESPTADDDFNSIWTNKTANDFTITEVWCESDQTIDFDLQVDDGSPADVMGSDLQCAAGENEDTSPGGDTELAAGEELDLIVTSVANTPTWVSICWTGNWKD